jgi:hypothetical protein
VNIIIPPTARIRRDVRPQRSRVPRWIAPSTSPTELFAVSKVSSTVHSPGAVSRIGIDILVETREPCEAVTLLPCSSGSRLRASCWNGLRIWSNSVHPVAKTEDWEWHQKRGCASRLSFIDQRPLINIEADVWPWDF